MLALLIFVFILALVVICAGFLTISKFNITEQAIRIWDRGLEKGESKDQITSEVSDFFAEYKESDLKVALGNKFKDLHTCDRSMLKKCLSEAKLRSILFICVGIIFIIQGFWILGLLDDGSSTSSNDYSFQQVNENRRKYGMQPLSKEQYNNRASRDEIERELGKALGQ